MRRTLFRSVLVVALLGAAAPIAWACSLVGQPDVRGALGFSANAFGSDVSGAVVPANVAATQGEGTPFVVEGIELVRLPPGPVEVHGTAVGRSTEEDVTPPSAVELSAATLSASGSGGGCGLGTCGRIVTIDLDVEATDDTAGRGRISYAIWFADDPGRFVGPPDDIVVRDPSDDRVWVYGTTADEGARLFAQVRAIDQAGNVGPASAPLQVDTGRGGGCRVLATPAAGTLAPLLLGLLWLRRRR